MRIGAEGVDVDVAASLNLSYRQLSPEAARVFRQLSVFPATFDAAAEAMDHSQHGGMDHSMHGGKPEAKPVDHSMHGGKPEAKPMDHSMHGGKPAAKPVDHSQHGTPPADGEMDHSDHGGKTPADPPEEDAGQAEEDEHAHHHGATP